MLAMPGVVHAQNPPVKKAMSLETSMSRNLFPNPTIGFEKIKKKALTA
jgi:hypothetical protein